jgi:hypothetical protein
VFVSKGNEDFSEFKKGLSSGLGEQSIQGVYGCLDDAGKYDSMCPFGCISD